MANCLLRGVTFYAYSISGNDLLSVIQSSRLSVMEELPIYGFSKAKQLCHNNISVIS